MVNNKRIEIDLLYPLLFHPIFKEKIWGGNILSTKLKKPVAPTLKIGESWEISSVKNNVSVVKNGHLAGRTLEELCDQFKGELLGEKVYKNFNNQFPLLIKFIDACDDLSVQVHPDDEIAKEMHNSFGKSEMWYIMEAAKNSEIIYGFDPSLDATRIKEKIRENKYSTHLNKIKVQKGDSYYIEPGTVHAIGKGILLAEIQQTSDITYRLFDYDRIASDGSKRALHIEESLSSLKNNTIKKNEHDELDTNLFNTPFFITNKFVLKKEIIKKDYTKFGSFIIYIVVEGDLLIESNNGINTHIFLGQVVLIPACLRKLSIKSSSVSTILEVFLPKE